MFSGPPTVQPGVVRVNWTAAGSSDPLVTRVRYALYSQCGSETTFQLIDDDIQGLSYNITTLPSLTQCLLRVVVYSDDCLLDVDGLLGDTTDNFTTGELFIVCQCPCLSCRHTCHLQQGLCVDWLVTHSNILPPASLILIMHCSVSSQYICGGKSRDLSTLSCNEHFTWGCGQSMSLYGWLWEG